MKKLELWISRVDDNGSGLEMRRRTHVIFHNLLDKLRNHMKGTRACRYIPPQPTDFYWSCQKIHENSTAAHFFSEPMSSEHAKLKTWMRWRRMFILVSTFLKPWIRDRRVSYVYAKPLSNIATMSTMIAYQDSFQTFSHAHTRSHKIY